MKRNTKTKDLVLNVLKAARTAVSHDHLQAELGKTVNRATIYRVLNSFCDDGILHKVLGDDGKHYFAFCLNCSEKQHRHNHLHFRCIKCGKVECLHHEIDLSLPRGYRAVDFNGFISGYCPVCKP
ncbi:Fur family transcriptional regulator [Compostibacter hankyongensis]|uniref:Ferric iron uptake transcriptional regulator n=1 Tax=Compostibacter hankyongensis TaxID=1007089 RepID=A0ABP8FMN0_9BACT